MKNPDHLLILASASQQRIDILTMLGIQFRSIPANINESDKPNEKPVDYVVRLSIEKAREVAQEFPEAYVIGSDLTVELNGQAIQKAETEDQAYTMLSNFSGTAHRTRCGYAIMHNNELLASGVVSTLIEFHKISLLSIKEYIRSKEWQNRAGAYGVQGSASKFVKSFQGSYFDILGLPIYEIAFTLIKFGFPVKIKMIDEIFKKDKEKIKLLNSYKNI